MRRLGQHFLKNQSVLAKIASALEIKPDDIIVEIGPGHGELTRHLLEKNPGKIIAVEKDERLAEKLKIEFREAPVEIATGDILKVLPDLSSNLESYKLIGNIPYYLTGRLMRIVGDLENKPENIVFLIQKEVAERIAAEPPQTNLLAASVQFWSKPEIIAIVKKSDFSPPPKVQSAVIRLEPVKNAVADKEAYYKLIKALFKQPRKTILNNLKSGGFKENEIEKLESLGLNLSLRPQNVSIAELASFTDALSSER